MRIDGINNVNNIQKANKASKAYGTSNVSTSKDSLVISDFAKSLQIAQQTVAAAPDVRQNKVDDIKQQMEAGTYNITASKVVEKLLKQYVE